MKAKKLSNKEKFAIVLEGLKGAGVADICARYGISQSHYYRYTAPSFGKKSGK